MKFTNKTFYAMGIVASACNLLGSVAYLLGKNLGLVFTVASVLSAAMMLFLAGYEKKNHKKQAIFVAACLLSLIGTLGGFAGIIGGAFSWPLFAFWFLLDSNGEESTIHTMAIAVIVCGVMYFVGGALLSGYMTARIAGCITFAIAAVQGVFAWVLYQNEKIIEDNNPSKSKLA